MRYFLGKQLGNCLVSLSWFGRFWLPSFKVFGRFIRDSFCLVVCFLILRGLANCWSLFNRFFYFLLGLVIWSCWLIVFLFWLGNFYIQPYFLGDFISLAIYIFRVLVFWNKGAYQVIFKGFSLIRTIQEFN